jgi:protocatechuate 3,4-dioxygenase alpha subunit
VTVRILTPSQTAGPLFGHYILADELKRSVRAGDNDPLYIEGQIFDGDGKPITREMLVEIWTPTHFARDRVDADGFYRIEISRPEPEILPDGRTLAPCLQMTAFGRGLARQVETRIYLPDEASNLTDPVLQLAGEDAQRLVAVRQPDSGALRFDIQLQGPRETPFFRY